MTPPPIEMSHQEIEALIERAKERRLLETDYPKVEAMGATIAHLSQVVNDKSTSIKRLLKMLFGASTEKTDKVVGKDPKKESQDKPEKEKPKKDKPKKDKKPGHGRNGAKDYTGADKIIIPHDELKHKDPCPLCPNGKVYIEKKPKILIRVTGAAPLSAIAYEMERLRCNLCGEVFTAKAPEDIGEEKYDPASGAMIALLKYGNGFPFYRLENLQKSLGIPVPASTQWDIVRDFYFHIYPVFAEFLNQGANGKVIHNDDTVMKVLSLMKENPSSDRKGMFTTGIVSITESQKIALFYTGRNHAGENITQLLEKRQADLGPPIQMCDALSRNPSTGFETLLANCLGHGRRRFVEIFDNFPDECAHILKELGKVYKNDEVAKEQNLSADERLHFHQTQSGPIMTALEKSMSVQIEGKKVEPNSGLGQAIGYMLKHWPELTLFLREPGAPLDNNICERALKKAILNRKNAMFYKTQRGANVGDLFMSVIHTCELNSINPFDYLVAIKENISQIKAPSDWMPWNYKKSLATLEV